MPKRDPRYDEARRQFDDLDVEEQSRFLIEATASTLARAILEVGTVLAGEVERLLRRARPTSDPEPHGPGPAEPETSQRQATRSGNATAERS